MNRRWVLPPVRWEFLFTRQNEMPKSKRDDRRAWLRRQNLRCGYAAGAVAPASLRPSQAVLDTYFAMLAVATARGSPTDALLAAHSIASRGEVVIATANAKDFCWHEGVVLVAELAAAAACP